MKKSRIIWISILLILTLFAGCAIYVSDYYLADNAALAATVSNDIVTVKQAEGTLSFIPESPTAGFIFYPGGKVEFSAYAPLLQTLAANNILCVLTEMPFHLAVLDVNAAEGIQEQYPEVKEWYIGGHSLGGSMAASYAADHADELKGLVLLASYSTADISGTDLKVISVYGSEDHVLNMEKYRQNISNLPEASQEAVITGGCHAHFGSYGKQEGDGIPSISAEEQIAITAELLTAFFLDFETCRQRVCRFLL